MKAYLRHQSEIKEKKISWDLEGCVIFAYTRSKEIFKNSILAVHWVPYRDLNFC